jgi:hypothetical protein
MAERVYGKVKSAELGPILSTQIAAHATGTDVGNGTSGAVMILTPK